MASNGSRGTVGIVRPTQRKGGYIPSLWGTLEEQQRALLQAMNDLLSGNRALPVQVVEQPPSSSNVRSLNPG